MPHYQVSWVYAVEVEAETKHEAVRRAREWVSEATEEGIVVDTAEIVEQDPLEVVELDADGNPL